MKLLKCNHCMVMGLFLVFASGTLAQTQTIERQVEQSIAIQNALSTISTLNPVTIEYETTFDNLSDTIPEVGDILPTVLIKRTLILPEELNSVYPEAVIKDNQGNLYTDYNALIPLLIESLKQQNNIIIKLQDRILEIEKNLKIK